VSGFEVYLDTEKTLVGEQFHAVIRRELKRCDGVVAIVSQYSAASPWCQAELYYAHALCRSIAPLRLGSETISVVEPLAALEQSLQYIQVRDATGYASATRALSEQLSIARRRRRRYVASRAVVVLALAVVAVFGWQEGIKRINAFTHERERASVLQRIHESTSNLTRDAVSAIVRQSSDDQELAGKLLYIAQDRERADIERINATLLGSALLLPRIPEKRWAIRGLDWHNSDLRRADFADLTFMTGRMNDLRFTDVTFGGVSWNGAPSPAREGVMLSNVVFDTSRFYSGWFRATGGVSVDFRNCRFRGTYVDVRGFGATRFASQQRDPKSPVITDEITVFENAVVSRCVPAPEAGVLEIVPTGSEVGFTDVIFDGSRLLGRLRAEWFKNCHFSKCILPRSLTRAALELQGNTLEDCIWVDQPCDWL
jgi:hypothetical protein